jgi:hypothetical protein
VTWLDLVPIIARYGVEFAYSFWSTVKDKTQPTEEDWQSILGLVRKPMSEYLAEARVRAGLPPEPPQAPSPTNG